MKARVRMWIYSVVFFVFVLCYGLWFVYKKTVSSMLILIFLMAAACIFYAYCSKKITLPGGYTVIQAWRFYRGCMKAGLDSRRKMKEDPELLQSVVKKYDFTNGMDGNAIWTLFCDGKAANEMKIFRK